LTLTVRRPIQIAPGPASGLGAAVALMAAIYTLLSVLPPYERISAARISAAGAAQYDYALRSLRAIQQLVLGGVYLAALGDWSASSRRGLGEEMRQSLSTALIIIGNVLIGCSCVALVAGQNAVSVIFQHGQFTAADTAAVTSILLIALPGFWAEGTGLMITSMLLANQRNGVLAALGVANFATRVGLIALFAPRYGAPGVALAYSIQSVAILVVLMVLALRLSLLSGATPVLRTWAAVGGVPIVMAVAALIFVPSGPRLFATLPVVVAFALLLRTFQPGLGHLRASRLN
jgi:putative peptidoglycan lipid II flippase